MGLSNFFAASYVITKMDYASRFEKTYLSFFWILLPTLGLFAISLLMSGSGINDFLNNKVLLVYTGAKLVAWQALADSLTESMRLSRRYRKLLATVAFNPLIILCSGFYYAAAQALVRLLILLAIAVTSGIDMLNILSAALIIILFGCLFGCTLAMFLIPSALHMFDVRYMVRYLLYLLMFLSPVFFVKSSVMLLNELNDFNPIAYFVVYCADLAANGVIASPGLFILLGYLLIQFGVAVIYFVRKIKLSANLCQIY